MRKSGIILASAAICFDLGVMVVPSQAAVDMFLKIDNVKNTAATCVKNKGTVVEKDGQKFCKTTKPDAPAKK